jgi:hypothetical protein
MHTFYTFIYITSSVRPKFWEVLSGSEGNLLIPVAMDFLRIFLVELQEFHQTERVD